MNAKICVSTKARDLEELVKNAVEAERAGADLVEARLDYLPSHEGIGEIPRSVNVPVIATARSAAEGGGFEGGEESRARLLGKAAESGFRYLDVELGSKALEKLSGKGNLIVSWHDFASTPGVEELEEVLDRSIRSGAEIAKIVTTAERSADNITVLRFLARHARSRKMVCFAMGEEGLPSRVLSPLFGSAFTYASLGRGKETAPGQVPVKELKQMLRDLSL
ncbi:MAG: type I 3-dehydroquinate dehydratase [Candidatus Brockarchaeota archaeon]|nr:type I 3-dehydroquinate dehydratase [Candidatus Brockarchaeota archaeon]